MLIMGDPMPEAVAQMEQAMAFTNASFGALMADHHVGYTVPIGGVLALKDQICVTGVGYDIGCGNMAVRLSVDGEKLRSNLLLSMQKIKAFFAFGTGGRNKVPSLHPLFDDPLWETMPWLLNLKEVARVQFGTIGSGNHYIDLLLDENNAAWAAVHFGSRGLGNAIATHFIKEARQAYKIPKEAPVVLPVDSDMGKNYLACMHLAGRFAHESRKWVCEQIAVLLKTGIEEQVHNHHNFAWQEEGHWVVRKGATPLFPGQRAFVGGSMNDICVIVEGIDSPQAKALWHSTIHGAGRVMSRTEAKRQINSKAHKAAQGDVLVLGGGCDESPAAYKSLATVLSAHAESLKIIHTLKPIGVAMEGGERISQSVLAQ